MAVTNEEKLKELLGQEISKRKEIEKAKEELEKKKKEIDDLEKKKSQEISAARQQIQSKMEEMVAEEQQDFIEQEEAKAKKEKEQSEELLEDKIDNNSTTNQTVAPRGYGDAIDDVLRGQPNFYSLTNYNVVNRLELIARDAVNRPLTSEESTFVSVVRYEAANMLQNQDYLARQGSDYLGHELRQAEKILAISRKRDEEMKKGDYNV